MGGNDYYQTLGISTSATSAEIKKAFRKLAKQHHPDKQGNAKKFRQIRVAFEALMQQHEVVIDVGFTRPNSGQYEYFQPEDPRLEGYERSVRAEGCSICHGIGYVTVNREPSKGFMGLVEELCVCQRIGQKQ